MNPPKAQVPDIPEQLHRLKLSEGEAGSTVPDAIPPPERTQAATPPPQIHDEHLLTIPFYRDEDVESNPWA